MAGQARRWTIAIGAAAGLALGVAPPAAAAITPVDNTPAGATALADAMRGAGFTPTAAGYEIAPTPPEVRPHGVGDSALGGFPTDGATFAILTTGRAEWADDPNHNVPDNPSHELTEIDDRSFDFNGGDNLDGPRPRGAAAFDVTVLRIGFVVPASANCLTLDFRFLSEEYQEFVGTFNDAFLAELDQSTWTTDGEGNISAPRNFAFDPSGNVISVNATGNTSMAPNTGTTYDGATPPLSASTVVDPGAHVLYLSIFDGVDQLVDSAAFVDAVRLGFVPDPEVNCRPGAVPRVFGLEVTPQDATNPVGTDHEVTATLTDDGEPVAGGEVSWTVAGANPATGSSTTGEDGKATFSYHGAAAGLDTISACYDADENGTCEATASATKRWLANLSVGDAVVPEGGTAQVPVTLDVPSPDDVRVAYGTADGSAVAPGDYAAKTGEVVIPAGQTSAVIEVPTNDDAIDEDDESFLVNVEASGVAVADDSGRVTIRDDEASGVFECRATPLRAPLLGEAFVANARYRPCTTHDTGLIRGVGTSTLLGLSLNASALRATTVQADGVAASTATVGWVGIRLPGLAISAGALTSAAHARCTDEGEVRSGGSAEVAWLTVNGRLIAVDGPVRVPLGIGTLYLNQVQRGPGHDVTARALNLDLAPAGPSSNDVVLAESRAGTDGDPCPSAPEES